MPASPPLRCPVCNAANPLADMATAAECRRCKAELGSWIATRAHLAGLRLAELVAAASGDRGSEEGIRGLLEVLDPRPS